MCGQGVPMGHEVFSHQVMLIRNEYRFGTMTLGELGTGHIKITSSMSQLSLA